MLLVTAPPCDIANDDALLCVESTILESHMLKIVVTCAAVLALTAGIAAAQTTSSRTTTTTITPPEDSRAVHRDHHEREMERERVRDHSNRSTHAPSEVTTTTKSSSSTTE